MQCSFKMSLCHDSQQTVQEIMIEQDYAVSNAPKSTVTVIV